MPNYIGSRNSILLSLTRITTRFLFFPFFKIIVTGEENLPQNDPFILLPKHQRWEDIPVLGMAITGPLYYIAKYELFLNPFSRWYLSSLGGIPLNRRKPMESRESLKTMLGYLRAGEGIVIFPEGTYYNNSMGAGHTGLIRMIQSRLTLPYVPVGIKYEEKGIRKFVSVKIGKPIMKYGKDLLDNFSELIMKEIARLSGL